MTWQAWRSCSLGMFDERWSWVGPFLSVSRQFSRHNLDGRPACFGTYHRSKIGTRWILHPIGFVDAVVERAIDRLEDDLFCLAGCGDSPRLLPQRGLIPTRL